MGQDFRIVTNIASVSNTCMLVYTHRHGCRLRWVDNEVSQGEAIATAVIPGHKDSARTGPGVQGHHPPPLTLLPHLKQSQVAMYPNPPPT